MPARPKIKDDNDVEMLLFDEVYVPEVYISVVEKQLATPFQSGGGSNNVLGSTPTTGHAFEIPSVNPVISEDPTINAVLVEPYNEDERSIPEYNPHSEYGLDDFDEDYIGDGGSREGMNDEPSHYHGMGSDPTDCGHSRSVPPVFTGPSRDTFEDDAINVGHRSGNAISQHWIIPGASNYSFELVRTEESSSCNRLSKCGMFKSKKGLKRALLSYALKENFKIRVTRSCIARYEVGCKDPECKFQFRAVKMEGGNYWIVRIFEEDHSCTIDDLHNRYSQASAWLIGEILSLKLAVSGRSLKPKEIMTDMQVEYGLGLLYRKALKAKELVEQNFFSPSDLSYQLLPAYCHQLKRVNPGTVTTIKTNPAKNFEYLLFPLSASLVGFQIAILLAIFNDATHFKGKFGGVMFIAACQDANNQELKKAIRCSANCIIISDRSPAINVAMAKEYPEITHGLCGFHMNMNLKNIFKSHVVPNLFLETSRAHRESEFLEKIHELSHGKQASF
ncbi:hypothetical protein Dsin_013501 [Dipteronia sinensis]|uniref:Transposase MuDR plant domain-containing protein n=1 Tax=Dipteronia sinensis TaxID=43782 RepID=A0AAE0E924_9ROSI|nr:hypothetical protein Dsin_013501 [Dipteronia sinensis]